MNQLLDDILRGREFDADVILVADSVENINAGGYAEIPSPHFFNAYLLKNGKVAQHLVEPIEIGNSLKRLLTGSDSAGRLVLVRNEMISSKFSHSVMVSGRFIELIILLDLSVVDINRPDHLVRRYGVRNVLCAHDFREMIKVFIDDYAFESKDASEFFSKLAGLEQQFDERLDKSQTGLFPTVDVYTASISEQQKSEFERYAEQLKTEQDKKILHFESEQEFKKRQSLADVTYKIELLNEKTSVIPALDGYKYTLSQYQINEIKRDFELELIRQQRNHALKLQVCRDNAQQQQEDQKNEISQVQHELNKKALANSATIDLMDKLRERNAVSPKKSDDEIIQGSGNLLYNCGIHDFSGQRAFLVKDFGAEFWGALKKENPQLDSLLSHKIKGAVRVCYSDNYINHPAHMLAFSKVAEWLFRQPCIDKTTLFLVSVGEPLTPHKFLSSSICVEVLKSHLRSVVGGRFTTVLKRESLPHDRKMEIHFADNSMITINLAQGFGCWKMADEQLGRNWLNMFSENIDAKQQVRNLIDSMKAAEYQSFVLREQSSQATVRTYICAPEKNSTH